MRRLFFPIILGVGGVVTLMALGIWQMQRLEWKEAILDEIDSRRAAPAIPLTLELTETADEYRVVTVNGQITGREIHVLASGTGAGTGYRTIAAFDTDAGWTVLVDLGLLPLEAKAEPPYVGETEITGSLVWPDDQTSSTPEPDLGENIWFARNVPEMAAALGAEPFLIVANVSPDTRLTALPVTTTGIKNDHLEYAITWFLLAAVWAVMSAVLILRTIRKKDA